MSQLRQIRRTVFGVTQTEFAKIAGVSQPLVSRWEKGDRKPSLPELIRIRAEARRRGLKWKDAWFFEEVAA
jgi:predicted transcriptional regulator